MQSVFLQGRTSVLLLYLELYPFCAWGCRSTTSRCFTCSTQGLHKEPEEEQICHSSCTLLPQRQGYMQ